MEGEEDFVPDYNEEPEESAPGQVGTKRQRPKRRRGKRAGAATTKERECTICHIETWGHMRRRVEDHNLPWYTNPPAVLLDVP